MLGAHSLVEAAREETGDRFAASDCTGRLDRPGPGSAFV